MAVVVNRLDLELAVMMMVLRMMGMLMGSGQISDGRWLVYWRTLVICPSGDCDARQVVRQTDRDRERRVGGKQTKREREGVD